MTTESTVQPARSAEFFGGATSTDLPVDRDDLRAEVRTKYGAVATDPEADFHFHTGRFLAERCRYDMSQIDALPQVAVESFAGVANPFELRSPEEGERVVDLGSGAGMDSFLAAQAVGSSGFVVGVEMTPAMVSKARSTAELIGLDNIDFCEGYLEELPVGDEWADVVISNGVVNLCPDKAEAFREAHRVLKPRGWLQLADIANGRPVAEESRRRIDLWTG